jgi:hypothetical protein
VLEEGRDRDALAGRHRPGASCIHIHPRRERRDAARWPWPAFGRRKAHLRRLDPRPGGGRRIRST